MDYRNSINSKHSLSSIFRGPHIFNLALTPEEEAAAAAKAAEDEAAAAEAARLAKEAEDAAAAEAAAAEDPLTAPNLFEAGTPQHDAFEKQREKFKLKLEREVEAAKKTATAELSGKMDELLTTLGTVIKPKPETKATPAEEPLEVTEADMKIVTGVLKKIGFDPTQAVAERRRNEVNAALAQLHKDHPEITFDDMELVKHANESGIAATNLPINRVLELAFLDKHRASLAKPATPAKPPVDPKKPAVPITATSTKKEVTPAADKPSGIGGWKAKIMKKYGGA